MDREQLQSLRDFQIARLRAWLEGDAAQALWVEQASLAVSRAMDHRIDVLIERRSLERAVEATLSAAVLDGVAQPLARCVADEAWRAGAKLDVPLGELLGAECRAALHELAAEPAILDAELVRVVTRDPAMEAVMRDVLFEALVAFNERTNPFVAPWGVPALLDALPRLGRSAIRGTFDKVRGEFERRLEPEMRRFLETFSRQSLDHMVDVLADKAGEPELVALRRNALDVLLAEPVRDGVWPDGDVRRVHVRRALAAAAAHVGRHPAVKTLVDVTVETLWTRWSDRPLGELLAGLGVALPEPEPFVAAVWPAVRALASDDAVFTAVAELIDETHEAWLEGPR